MYIKESKTSRMTQYIMFHSTIRILSHPEHICGCKSYALKSEEFSLKCRKPDCKSYSLKNDEFCFFHSQKPDIIAKRELAQSKGGRKPKINKEPISIESLTDIQKILLEALNEIRYDDTDNIVSKSRATAYICLILTNLKERIELEKRVEALEKYINNGY